MTADEIGATVFGAVCALVLVACVARCDTLAEVAELFGWSS